MSAHHQDASGHFQFRQSAHRQRVTQGIIDPGGILKLLYSDIDQPLPSWSNFEFPGEDNFGFYDATTPPVYLVMENVSSTVWEFETALNFGGIIRCGAANMDTTRNYTGVGLVRNDNRLGGVQGVKLSAMRISAPITGTVGFYQDQGIGNPYLLTHTQEFLSHPPNLIQVMPTALPPASPGEFRQSMTILFFGIEAGDVPPGDDINSSSFIFP